MSPSELAKLRQLLNEYLDRGWVCPSMSQYRAPIFFVVKKDRGAPYVYKLLGKKNKQINKTQPLSITSD